MISPEVQRGLLGLEPANVGTPALRLFQVIATGEIVTYPRHYIFHPGLIGKITFWPTIPYDESNYPSMSNFPSSDNYPGA